MSDLQNKLFHYEAPPPAHLWDEIEAALDVPAGLQRRLHDFQQTPPAQNWDKINNALESILDGKVLPQRTRTIKSVMRYLTAAAVLLIVATGVVWWMRRGGDGSESIQPGNTATTTPDSQSSPDAIPYNAGSPDEAVEARTANGKTAHLDNNRPRQRSVNQASLSASLATKSLTPRRIVQTNTADKYMIYSTAAGNSIRLPKKLYTLFSCADNPNTAQAFWCQQNIRILQQRMAETAPASADFASMLDMIRELQENQ